MSNRKQLLEAGLTEDKNVQTVVESTIAKDTKALKKARRDVEDAIEDAEEALEARLSLGAVLDKAVVENTYSNLKDLKAKLELYKEFEAEFLTTEK